VMVQEEPPQGMITLRGDLVSPPVQKAVKACTKTVVPQQGWVVFEGNDQAVWMSPDELLLLVPYTDISARLEKIKKAMNGEHFLAENVSDARAMFTASGPGVREVLAKLTPADVSAQSLAPGHVRRTRLAQVPAAFWLEDDETCRIICFRSVAQYVFDLLKTAAAPETEVGFT